MPVAEVLAELVRFATAYGADIAGIVEEFSRQHPELVTPPDGPPEPAQPDIDTEVDRLIDEGEV